MSINADNLFTLHISKKRNQLNFGVTKDSTYLDVTIIKDLSWENHISNITAKANRTIGFLRRNIHARMSEISKSSCIHNTSATIY